MQVRPGTDGALSLAWLNVIFAEGLYDKEFVDKWTNGFGELVEHIKPFTPDWVYIETPRGRCRQKAKLTLGIDAKVIMAEHDWVTLWRRDLAMIGRRKIKNFGKSFRFMNNYTVSPSYLYCVIND